VICTGIGGMAEKVVNRRSGLHFRAGDGADLAKVMIEAADDVLYRALCSSLPKATDETSMAREYLATFSRPVKSRQITLPEPVEAPPAPARAARRKTRAQSTIGPG
jgi:glycosyltransferase involved in cell wall biosynthesis